MGHNFDLPEFFNRDFIGLDRMLDHFLERSAHNSGGYPPYDIEKLDDENYRLTLAVAGFTKDDIDIVVRDNVLEISGSKKTVEETENRYYLHKGIATRSFARKYTLADYINVVDARLENGLLVVDLKRELPEERKPKQIPIS